ncbi:unnamed protein product [Urochloa humidicola]
MEAEQEEVIGLQTKENNDEKTTSTNEGRESEQEKVAKFYVENHSHIVCEHSRDKFTSVVSFLAGKDKFKSVDVPGKKAQIKVTKEVIRRLLIGILVRFRVLHSEGKTRNGCFTADNLCVPIYKKEEDIFMAPFIEVKLDYLHPDSIQPYTDDGGNKDLMKLGWVLENNIFASETQLPYDLKQLLELLCTDPIKSKDLIYGHVSLKSPREQVSYYLWLYKRLMYLKKRVSGSYNNIMQKLKTKADGWRSKAKLNRFLAKLNPSRNYSNDGKGLSRFYRNAVEHLFKMFEDSKRNSTSMVEEDLEDYHIIYILTDTFPSFLVDLQKAFYEEGELEKFNNEELT